MLLLEIGFGGFGRGAGLTNWKKEGGKVRPWVGGKEDWVRRGRGGLGKFPAGTRHPNQTLNFAL